MNFLHPHTASAYTRKGTAELFFVITWSHLPNKIPKRADQSFSVVRAFTGHKTGPRNGCRLIFKAWGGIRLNSRVFLQNTSRILHSWFPAPNVLEKLRWCIKSSRATEKQKSLTLPRLNTFHIPPFHQISRALFHHKQTQMQHILAEYLPERLAQTIDL